MCSRINCSDLLNLKTIFDAAIFKVHFGFGRENVIKLFRGAIAIQEKLKMC